MPISFILQCLFYDRPRRMQKLKLLMHSEDQLLNYIDQLDNNDPFKTIAKDRFLTLGQVVAQMKAFKIHWLDSTHTLFPASVLELPDPPMGLFYLGDIQSLSAELIGVVGTRRPSITAHARVESILAEFYGLSTISGGALGIDALVHQFSLEFNVPTIAVLASGLDQLTPRTNARLFKKLIDSGRGCIISECPPGVLPKPYFFPQRNRLIAVLSTKLIVIEAAKRSGAVLTANLAAGFGKDVGALVSGYGAQQSEGCYELMNDGAYVIGNRKMLHDFLGTQMKQNGKDGLDETNQLLSMIPVEPIHIEDLALRLAMPLNKLIEHVTALSLNEDVVVFSGQMVRRNA
ncbi:MAG: DNA-processing protein DprA [Candidatus Margulisiibacteriota bacterium]